MYSLFDRYVMDAEAANDVFAAQQKMGNQLNRKQSPAQ
jgi:hypothetical protein